MEKSFKSFFSLLRAGLWEQSIPLSSCGPIDFEELYRLAEKQTVIGLIAAGLEHVEGLDASVVPQRFSEATKSLEQGNQGMNKTIAWLFSRLEEEMIRAVLVKGAGIAQCYQRPMWRAVGDIDLLLDAGNYRRAKETFLQFAKQTEAEDNYSKHLSLMFGTIVLELHGTMRTGLSSRIDNGVDVVLNHIFFHEGIRIWRDGDKAIPLPAPDDDAILIFTHFLKHFYKGGIGLRQICDWCRLLWTYKEEIDTNLLKKRLAGMGLTTEWMVFGTYAVEYLGMPAEAMPMYESSPWRSRKAKRVNRFILEVGNFSSGRYKHYLGKGWFARKMLSFSYRIGDLIRHAFIFPLDSFRFFPSLMFHGFQAVSPQLQERRRRDAARNGSSE